jgi:peptide/nickel transport system ATP-binding protein
MLIGAYEDLWKPAADASAGIDAVSAASFGDAVPRPSQTFAAIAPAPEPDEPGHAHLKPLEAGYAATHRGEKPVLTVDNISKHYIRRRGFKKTRVDAVADVSFQLRKGYITALVGQSGSGKSTIGRLVTGVERPDEGAITFETTRVDQLSRDQLKEYRTHVQLVFQDPYSAINPAHTIGHSLSRPLANFKGLRGNAARARVHEMLEQVGLTPASRFIDKYPHQLSGGQRQRVVVARALAPGPEVLIADEPTSMLDVSIRAEILEILNRLVRDQGIAMLYITHDLLSARMLADEILVLNKGRVVESGDATSLIAHPKHEYTQLLLSSIPNPFAEGMVAD